MVLFLFCLFSLGLCHLGPKYLLMKEEDQLVIVMMMWWHTPGLVKVCVCARSHLLAWPQPALTENGMEEGNGGSRSVKYECSETSHYWGLYHADSFKFVLYVCLDVSSCVIYVGDDNDSSSRSGPL